MQIAIIGAGMAGLTCARALLEAGVEPVVFDKARGPGGRMSTRRRDGVTFDHGAQFFTVRDGDFGRAVEAWAVAGVVARWNGRFGRLTERKGRFVAAAPSRPRWVGAPRMSALTRYLARDLDLRTQTRIGAVKAIDGRWALTTVDGDDAGTFDRVVVATPSPQAVPLLADAPALAARAQASRMRPSWAVMARLDKPLDVPFDAVDVVDSAVGWAARNSSKPGRPGDETWVLLARAGWAAAHVEDAFEDVADAQVAAFAERVPGFAPVEAIAHRWRYALVDSPVAPAAHLDPSGIGACGDWCVGPRVESAWLSGRAMAARLAELK